MRNGFISSNVFFALTIILTIVFLIALFTVPPRGGSIICRNGYQYETISNQQVIGANGGGVQCVVEETKKGM